MKVAAQQPCFLPWVGFYHKMASVDLFLTMAKAQYTKGDYFNRVRLEGKWMTVPIVAGTGGPITEVRIDPAGVRKIAERLRHYAASQPYGDRLRLLIKIMEDWKDDSLYHLNAVTTSAVLATIDLRVPQSVAGLGQGADANERLWSMLQLSAPSISEYYSGSGGKAYMKEPYPIPTKFQSIKNGYGGDSIVKVIATEPDPLNAVINSGVWHE